MPPRRQWLHWPVGEPPFLRWLRQEHRPPWVPAKSNGPNRPGTRSRAAPKGVGGLQALLRRTDGAPPPGDGRTRLRAGFQFDLAWRPPRPNRSDERNPPSISSARWRTCFTRMCTGRFHRPGIDDDSPPRRTYQLLTKRAERFARFLREPTRPLNVWLGVTIEIVATVPRIDLLRQVSRSHPFPVGRAVAGGPGTARPARHRLVIVGGESGPAARPMQPEWALAVRDQCRAAVSRSPLQAMGCLGTRCTP